MFNEKNNSNPFTYHAPVGTPFVKLSEFGEHADSSIAYRVRGWYFTSGKYGEQCSLIMESCIINLPSHLTEKFKSIQGNPEEVNAVNNGHLGIIPYTYQDRNGVNRWSVRLADI